MKHILMIIITAILLANQSWCQISRNEWNQFSGEIGIGIVLLPGDVNLYIDQTTT